mmetsp:Transcript_27787/g.62671  ORF Transcript_27787/g.62671 Transcript_27787/m.62671 type:complete len:268 (-) Transcript_27787:518-1321(-)
MDVWYTLLPRKGGVSMSPFAPGRSEIKRLRSTEVGRHLERPSSVTPHGVAALVGPRSKVHGLRVAVAGVLILSVVVDGRLVHAPPPADACKLGYGQGHAEEVDDEDETELYHVPLEDLLSPAGDLRLRVVGPLEEDGVGCRDVVQGRRLLHCQTVVGQVSLVDHADGTLGMGRAPSPTAEVRGGHGATVLAHGPKVVGLRERRHGAIGKDRSDAVEMAVHEVPRLGVIKAVPREELHDASIHQVRSRGGASIDARVNLCVLDLEVRF